VLYYLELKPNFGERSLHARSYRTQCHSLPKMFFNTLIASSVLAFSHFCAGQVVDVAIIGGGLSGLTAARDLIAAGKSVIVLEARNRTGGRVLNAPLSNGGVTEVGAEFVGPTQDRVIALAKSLGLKLYNTYDNGSYILYENSTVSLYEPYVHSPFYIFLRSESFGNIHIRFACPTSQSWRKAFTFI